MYLNYKKYGKEGENVIIIHGLFGTLDNWQWHAKKLSENFVVYTLDMRNHGKSPHDDVHNYAAMCNDIKDFCEQHEIAKSHFIGHSMGGKVIMQLANDFPFLIEKLIVCDMSPFDYPSQHTTIFNALFDIPIHTISTRKEAEQILQKHDLSEGEIQFLLKSLTRAELGFEWKFNLKALHENYNLLMKKLDIQTPILLPVLFLKGEFSHYIPFTIQNDIIQIFPLATFDYVKHAHHWLHADNPEDFYAKVIDFLM